MVVPEQNGCVIRGIKMSGLQNDYKKHMVFLAAAGSLFFMSACGKKSETESLKRDFLSGLKEKIQLTEVYNSYSGSPYEGERMGI